MGTETPTKEQVDETVKQAMASVPSTQKIDLFMANCARGMDVVTAMQKSGLIDNNLYDPSNPEAEVNLEQLLFDRMRAKLDTSRANSKYAVFADADFPEVPVTGDLKQSQLFRLVDWMYFTRSIPLSSIAVMLQLPAHVIGQVKGAISNEFARSIRQTNGEGYIADLLRKKDLLVAQLTADAKTATAQVRVQISRIVWEMENRFVDRLQEIGLIDKTLGRIDVNEEWYVTLDGTGQPHNNKMKVLAEKNEFEPVDDVEFVSTAPDPFDHLAASGLADRSASEPFKDETPKSDGQPPDPATRYAVPRSTIKIGEDS